MELGQQIILNTEGKDRDFYVIKEIELEGIKYVYVVTLDGTLDYSVLKESLVDDEIYVESVDRELADKIIDIVGKQIRSKDEVAKLDKEVAGETLKILNNLMTDTYLDNLDHDNANDLLTYLKLLNERSKEEN